MTWVQFLVTLMTMTPPNSRIFLSSEALMASGISVFPLIAITQPSKGCAGGGGGDGAAAWAAALLRGAMIVCDV